MFWPVERDQTDINGTGERFDLVGAFRNQNLYPNLPSSDHKAVWLDVEIAPVPELLIRHELNMSTVRPGLVEGLCFDKLSTNGLANKPGRINKPGP